MSNINNQKNTDVLLSALGEQLAVARERFELVVVGGSGLLAIGAIERATRDVDLVALRGEDGLGNPDPLPAALSAARERVALDFSLPPDWLNAGPAGLLDLGLPNGFEERLVLRDYGPGLAVYFASRLDQIHFKLYALVDQGPGKHEEDLRALSPTADELAQAARWSRTQDPSEGFEQILRQVLSHLGVDDVDLGA
jgi:hypothetical protein